MLLKVLQVLLFLLSLLLRLLKASTRIARSAARSLTWLLLSFDLLIRIATFIAEVLVRIRANARAKVDVTSNASFRALDSAVVKVVRVRRNRAFNERTAFLLHIPWDALACVALERVRYELIPRGRLASAVEAFCQRATILSA